MTISEIMQQIKEYYTDDIMDIITQADESGRGYVCPVCSSGTGKHGTGMTAGTQNPLFFQCWACGFKGDIFDIIQAVYHCPDAVSQIKKAEELLHREFLTNDKNAIEYKRVTPKPAGKVNKNMVKNKDNKTLVEKVREAQERNEKLQKIREYIKKSREALPTATDGLKYLKQRGISEETALKYRLGYTPLYYGEMNTPAIIFPKYVNGRGYISYTARSIEKVEQGRKVRHNSGEQGIFNLPALQNPGAVVFLVEGEFDAISILEAGFVAISTSGNTKKPEDIAKILKESKTRPVQYVIIPDNDRKDDGTPDEGENKGYSKGLKLWEALKTEGIPVKMIDTRKWNPDIKDCNDYLVADRAGFKEMLREIVEPIATESLRKLGRASDYVQDFIDHISGKTAPISTGYKTVDKLLDGGLHPGLIVIGAISSLGKTTFVLNLCDNIAAAGQDIILFSLEMSKYELMAKSISRKTFEYCRTNGRPAKYAKTNLGVSDFDRYERYGQEEQEIIYGCLDEYQRTAAEHIYVIEGVGDIGTDAIRKAVENHFALTGNKPIVVIDYMQILSPASERSTDKQNTDRNVVELKRISRDFNIPVIGISSFNRDNYREPVSMSAFKESGSIEYTSDILIGLQYHGMDYESYTDDKNKTKYENEKDARRVERLANLFQNVKVNSRAGEPLDIDIKILKNRSGAKGEAVIKYYPKFNCYIED